MMPRCLETTVQHRRAIAFAVYCLAGIAVCRGDDILGPVSCATSTCHGGVVNRGPTWNHAHSIWIAQDPHAGAGRLLRDSDSRSIVVRLDPASASDPERFDTVLRQRCISCHITTSADQCSQTGKIDDSILSEGVSCESCHGAADRWLQPHLQTDWIGQRRFESTTGMRDNESIIGRSETCVRCHVGSRTADGLIRDVNHDLIAAGHPALRFDLLIYNENLPKHWSTDDAAEVSFNESAVRIRKVSRAIGLAAAASLSSQRATGFMKDRGKSNSLAVPWPELADYDCFACHQSLSIDEFRLPPTGTGKSPLHISSGLPIWNAWHTLNQLQLESKRSTLEALSPHRSDPSRLATQCRTLATRYRELAIAFMKEPVVARNALKAPMKQLQARPPVDWHHAAIQYLEIEAALRDLADEDSTAATGRRFLRSLRAAEPLLRFDPLQSSVERASYLSPATFDAEAFRTTVLGLFKVDPFKKPVPFETADPKVQSLSTPNAP